MPEQHLFAGGIRPGYVAGIVVVARVADQQSRRVADAGSVSRHRRGADVGHGVGCRSPQQGDDGFQQELDRPGHDRHLDEPGVAVARRRRPVLVAVERDVVDQNFGTARRRLDIAYLIGGAPGNGFGVGARAGLAVEVDGGRDGRGVGGVLRLRADDRQPADVEDEHEHSEQNHGEERHVEGDDAALIVPEPRP